MVVANTLCFSFQTSRIRLEREKRFFATNSVGAFAGTGHWCRRYYWHCRCWGSRSPQRHRKATWTWAPRAGPFVLPRRPNVNVWGALDAGASQLNSGRALKLLTFLVGQCHDDRIFIDAKELGRVVVEIAED